MSLFYHLYHTNHPLENRGTPDLLGSLSFVTILVVKTKKLRNFAWKPKGELQVSLFFHSISHKSPPWKTGSTTFASVTPFFCKKWASETQISYFVWNHIGSIQPLRRASNESIVTSIWHKSPPWKTGTTKLAWVSPFFHKKNSQNNGPSPPKNLKIFPHPEKILNLPHTTKKNLPLTFKKYFFKHLTPKKSYSPNFLFFNIC